jgi:hypothetical protein
MSLLLTLVGFLVCQVYQAYEEESYARLLTLIDATAGQLPKEIFTDFADKIYKRQK